MFLASHTITCVLLFSCANIVEMWSLPRHILIHTSRSVIHFRTYMYRLTRISLPSPSPASVFAFSGIAEKWSLPRFIVFIHPSHSAFHFRSTYIYRLTRFPIPSYSPYHGIWPSGIIEKPKSSLSYCFDTYFPFNYSLHNHLYVQTDPLPYPSPFPLPRYLHQRSSGIVEKLKSSSPYCFDSYFPFSSTVQKHISV